MLATMPHECKQCMPEVGCIPWHNIQSSSSFAALGHLHPRFFSLVHPGAQQALGMIG